MVRMRKEENWYGYSNVIIETDNGDFEISFQGNGDLYWSLYYIGNRLDIPDKFEIIIDRETKLYDTFERLFFAIKNNNPYSNSPYYLPLTTANFSSIEKRELLFKNGKIEWHSDDFPYEEASILTISREENNFKIQFKKSANNDLFTTYVIRICNSGSRYNPFNIAFMNMYNELLNYDYTHDIAYLKPVKRNIKKIIREL